MVYKSAEVTNQIAESVKIKDNLVNYFNNAKSSDSNLIESDFYRTIKFSAEGFVPEITAVAVGDVDRTASMLSGPFFTNPSYPVPNDSGAILLPIVQLDLQDLSNLSGVALGDSLLQLWCRTDWRCSSRGFIRLIPRIELKAESLTDFSNSIKTNFGESPIPSDFIFSIDSETVNLITGYKSDGLQCQTGYLLSVYAEDVPEEILEPVFEEIEKFEQLTPVKNDLHVLGSFYPIQYSSVDVDGFCLISFPQWGSDCNAQIIYNFDEDGLPSFEFVESIR